MLLVAPPGPCRQAPAGDRATGDAGGGRELLARLRGDTRARPRFDPGLAGGLRAWLEDAAYEATRGMPHGAPVLLGPRRLLGSDAEGQGGGTMGTPVDRLLHQVVHAAFRQLVQTGAGDVPLRDALDALVAAGDRSVAEEVASLEDAERGALADALRRHVRALTALLPSFAPAWFPRTDEYVAIPLAGGRVVLHGVFDLLVGLPRPGSASLCALGLAMGDRARQRRSLHFLALLETLRGGAPPFRLALLEPATGLYGVEDVREEHLRAMAGHVAAWLAGLGDVEGG